MNSKGKVETRLITVRQEYIYRIIELHLFEVVGSGRISGHPNFCFRGIISCAYPKVRTYH